MRARLPLMVIVLLAQAQGGGQFASHAVALSVEAQSHSPDGRSVVKAHWVPTQDENVRRMVLETSGAFGVKSVPIGPGISPELLWAPNSQAFAVTSGGEGASGGFRTIVVGRLNGVIQTRDLTSLIYRAFGNPVRCRWPEVPNIAAITWLNGSQRLVVAVQLIDHSNCDSYGTFSAFEIDPWARRIIHRYDQLQAKRIFAAQLGPGLLAANDNCLRQPPSCYVRANHPELAAH